MTEQMETRRWLYAASSYSGEKREDLLFFSADERGMMREEGRFLVGNNPSFLCKAGDTLYVGLEKPDEAVILSYHVAVKDGVRIEQTGRLRTEGSGLCHIWAGREAVYGCCYGSGHVFAADRKLEHVLWKTCPQAEPGIAPHAHCSMETEDGKMLVEADLGMNAVYGFPLLDGKAIGEKVILAGFAGMGPRQVLYDKYTKQFLVAGELGNSIAGFEWKSGQLSSSDTWLSKWSIPATNKTVANYPGGVCSTETGLLFWGNRGADTIAAAVIGETAQFLGEWSCGGSWPRSVLVSKNCVFAACQKSGTVESFVWNGSMLTKADRMDLKGAACVAAWDFPK